MGLQTIPTYTADTIDSLIIQHSKAHSINPLLIRAIMKQESGGNSDAYSHAGAIGLLQIMPENAKRCGLSKISKLWDESNNIRCGIQIIKEELTFFRGNLHKALQSYFGGTKNVDRLPASARYANEVIAKFASLAILQDDRA